MRCKPLMLFTTALCALLAASAHAITMEQWAVKYGIQTDASYDATRIVETKDGNFSFKERKAPGMATMEMNMGGMQGTAIIREDLKKAWFLMPDMGFYREMDMRQALTQQADSMQVRKVEEVGREEVNGFTSRKFKSRFKDGNGKAEGFMWITDDGVPVKMDMVYSSRGMKGQRMKMELTDLQMRAQDASHFELPEDLKPLSVGAMMSMAMQMKQDSKSESHMDPGAGQDQQPTMVEEVVEEVAQAAEDETKSSLKDETRNLIRNGIRGLFKR